MKAVAVDEDEDPVMDTGNGAVFAEYNFSNTLKLPNAYRGVHVASVSTNGAAFPVIKETTVPFGQLKVPLYRPLKEPNEVVTEANVPAYPPS